MYCIQIERGVLRGVMYYAIRRRKSNQDIPLHHEDSLADDVDAPGTASTRGQAAARRGFSLTSSGAGVEKHSEKHSQSARAPEAQL